MNVRRRPPAAPPASPPDGKGRAAPARKAVPRRGDQASSADTGLIEDLPPPSGGAAQPGGPSRWRRVGQFLWTGTKLLGGVALVVGASGLLAFGVHRYATQTPRFAIREIEVLGAARRAPEAVARLAGIDRGVNVFTVDPAAAERALLTDPWIREARVTRVLPATLRIEVSEREAGALAALGDHVYLLTRQGEPIKEAGESDPWDLPMVTGLSAENLARDREREIERAAVGLEVLRHWEQIPESKVWHAEEVHLGDDGTVTLSVGRSGTALALGKGPWRKKLLMAARVLGSLQARGRVPEVVFLDNQAHPERVVVRMGGGGP